MNAPRMSGRERVLAAMRRQPVDYVPCVPLVNPLTAAQRRGRPWNFPWAEPGDGLEYLATEMGTDPVVGLWWMGGLSPDPEVTTRTWREGDLLHKTFLTPSGDLHASVAADEQWPFGDDIPFFHDFAGHYREAWVKTERDVACLRHIFRTPRRRDEIDLLRADFDRGKATADRLGLATMATVGSGLTGALWMFGAERLCLLTIDDPGLVEAYLEVEHRWNLAILDLVLGWGVDIVRRNGFYESCDFYGPATLRTLLGRRLSEEIRLVHQGGAVIGYTLLTGVTPMCEHLASLDFDCIVCPDIFMKGMDGPAIAAALGGRKSFWTGPSDTLHMPWDRPEEVRKAVRRVFEVFGKTGLILTPCSSSKAVFPWRNVLAMVDEWKALRDQ